MAVDDQSRRQVKAWFESNGLSVTEWAEERGFRREQVYAVLNGRASGRRGEAHRIALALGLKKTLRLVGEGGAFRITPTGSSAKPEDVLDNSLNSERTAHEAAPVK